MKTSSLFLFIIALFICNISNSQTNQKGFTIIPLGVKGGLDESNLSAYLVKANGAEQYICLDAGTIYAGLQKATLSNYFGPLHDATEIQKKFIAVLRTPGLPQLNYLPIVAVVGRSQWENVKRELHLSLPRFVGPMAK